MPVIRKFMKMMIDIFMIILMLAAMAYSLTGNMGHELLGVLLFLLFVIHNALNWRWYTAVLKGKYSVARFINTAVNLALLIVMLALMISGVYLSHDVFAFMGLEGGLSARSLHIGAAYWGFVLMSVHLGMHWGMIMGVVGKMAGATSLNRCHMFILRTSGASVALYGMYAFAEREVPRKLSFSYAFDFWNYAQPPVVFFIDFISIMVFFVWAVHYIRKGIQTLQEGRALN